MLAFASTMLNAQQSSCCSAPEQFAALSNDIAFVNKHEEPIPFNFISDAGKTITAKCADGTAAKGYGIMAATKSNKYVFVFHEWWGLNDYIKQASEQLYKDLGNHVNIIAIDLYDGKVATVRDSATAYMSGLSTERAKSIINAFITMAGDSAAIATIATIGWCMGGGYSLQGSLLMDKKAVGCIMYYGMPETNVEKLKTLNADVLMIWPNQDKWINAEVVDQFKLDMASAKKYLRVEEYTADHAFANPSNPKYNFDAAADAYKKSLRFLKLKFELF